MSVPTNCVSCTREMYTNPPIDKDIMCETCEENEELKTKLFKYEKALQEIQTLSQYPENGNFAIYLMHVNDIAKEVLMDVNSD